MKFVQEPLIVDASKWNLSQHVSEILLTSKDQEELRDFSSPISQLHLLQRDNKLLKKGTDQDTIFHKRLYASFDEQVQSSFLVAYYSLCKYLAEIIGKSIKEENECLAVQRYPTLRIQYPSNISVFEFHRDSTYNHPTAEINCFMALTTCRETATLQYEQSLGYKDFIPLNLNQDCLAVLNTSVFEHGDVPNLESYTRVSIDFRFIPQRLLNHNNMTASTTSLTSNRRFTTDDYFISLSEI